jgi:hypothetical protein
MMRVTLATIEAAVADIRDGRMIIIVDDEDRGERRRSGLRRREGHSGNQSTSWPGTLVV